MTAVGDARKRLHPTTTGLPGYFVAGDAWGDQIIWRGATSDNCPQPVAGIDGWIVQRDDPELWAAIVAAVEGGVA